MTLAADAVRTLVGVADVLQDTRDAWWLIGGAAVALHGVATDVADVDVLLSEPDALHLFDRLEIERCEDAPGDRFRSRMWVRWTALPLSVDLVVDFQVRGDGGWIPIVPMTREPAMLEERVVYVPSRAELIAISIVWPCEGSETGGRPRSARQAIAQTFKTDRRRRAISR